MYGQARFAVSALTAALLSSVAPDLPASQQHSRQPASPTAPTSSVEPASGSSVPAGTTEQKARDAYGKLPLAFVPNAGQGFPDRSFSSAPIEVGRRASQLETGDLFLARVNP
jgi:hypothetical protein